MQVSIIYWEEDGDWLGYLQEYPDYWTQGETLDDLREHLKDLYKDVTSGQIPGIRKVGHSQGVGDLAVARNLKGAGYVSMDGFQIVQTQGL